MTARYDDVQIKMTDEEAKTAGDTPPKADDISRQTYESNPYVVTAERGVHLKIPPKVTIVPKPWRKIKHIIIASYFSMICLCVPGVFANKYAWEARRYKELGLHSEARVLAKNSVCCIYTALVIGLVIVVINIILALVLWT